MGVTMKGWAKIICSPLGLEGMIIFSDGAPSEEIAKLEAWSKPSTKKEEAHFGAWLADAYSEKNDVIWQWAAESETCSDADGYLVHGESKKAVQLTQLSPVVRGDLGRNSTVNRGVISLPHLVLEAAKFKHSMYGGDVSNLILGLVTFVPLFPAYTMNFPGCFPATCPVAVSNELRS
jgi:hypothetical protein